MQRRAVSICLVLAVAVPALARARPPEDAAPAPAQTLTIQEQREDLAFLRSTLEQYHPGLYVYTTPEELDQAFASARAALKDGATPLSFAWLAWGAVAPIGCTHTRVGFPELAPQPGWFPRDLVVADGRLWVDPRTHAGAPREIVDVEGVSGDALLADLRAHLSGDGRADAPKDARIDVRGSALTTMALGPHDVWSVTTRAADGALLREEWPGDPSAPIVGGSGVPPHPDDDPEVAYLRMDDLADGDRDIKKRGRQLHERLEEPVRAVVIDLRANGGGSTNALLDLWAQFAERPFVPYVEGWARATDPKWPLDLIDRWYELQDWHYDPAAALFRTGPEGLYSTVAPAEEPVTLPVWVITGNRTGSSASDLAFFFQHEGRGTIVGAETASGRWLQNCERYWDFVLPHSRLELTVPLRTLVTVDEAGRGHGVVPDVPVPASPAAWAEGRDPPYECAMALARGQACPALGAP